MAALPPGPAPVGEPLELPEWTEALARDTFDCSPVKQPLAQATLKDGNTQRVRALGRPAVAGPVKPVFAAPKAAQPEPRVSQDAENDASGLLLGGAAAAASDEPPRSVRRTHTPSRTGLTAKAVRMPSRLGMTPGAKQPAAFEVPQSARAAAKTAVKTVVPPTGGILKRLNFSATKLKAAGSTVATAEAPSTSAAAALQPGGAAAAESTIKQLRFDGGATPAAGTAAKPSARHVTFDAATISPAARGRPSRIPSVGPAGARLAFKTPEPTIQEEDSGSSGGSDDGVGGSSVNSARAGHTPYDRRLSSLFRKYQVAGTPELLAEAELDDLVADGAVRSPSWKRLSSASVPESIKELSKKYDGSEATGTAGSAAAPTGSQAQAAMEAEGEDAATPLKAQLRAEGAEPGGSAEAAAGPTPHHLLDSLMKRNALFETSPTEAPLPVSVPAEQMAALALDEPAAADAAAAGAPPSPANLVAQVLGPVLAATVQEIDAARQASQGTASAAPAPPVSSPAEFYGFPLADGPAGTAAATPSSLPPSGNSSVPRDSEGIPLRTPATVTVRRGGYSGGALVEPGDLGLAANLFESFSPVGDSPAPAGGSPADLSIEPLAAEAAAPAADEATTPAAGEAAQPAGADSSADFSFFPAAGSSRQHHNGAAAHAAGSITPELAACGSTEPAGASFISPEILGFYEAREQAAAAADIAGQACAATPKLPRSILKSGRPLNEAGSPVLGHAQRMPGEAPPTITKELQALMADLRLEDRTQLEQMGTASTLSPVRATGSMRSMLGGAGSAITPVRRSTRKKAQQRPLQDLLEETGFAYVPNVALMPEDAQPKQEAAEAKAARKAASHAGIQAAEASPAGKAAVPAEQATGLSSAASGRRYSTRSAARAADAGAAAAAPAAAASWGMSTPVQQWHAAAGEATPAATPQLTAAVDSTPVAQDASPHLADSPSYAAVVAAPPGSYNLRPSTLKKARQSMGTPLPAAQVQGSARRERQASAPQLSPTEQGIRASLRRSARKSRGGQ